MSTETFSGDTSAPILARALELLNVDVSEDAFWTLHAVSRKLAHLIEYGIFGFLLYRSFAGGNRTSSGWQPRTAAWSIVAAAAYSAIDELHQAFVRGRGASLIDCGLDVSGAALAMLLVYLSYCALEKRARARPVASLQ